MKNRLLALLALVGLGLGVLVAIPVVTTASHPVPVAVASAGNCTIPNIVCGKIKNNSNATLWIAQNYGQAANYPLAPGQTSTRAFVDTDAIRPVKAGLLCAPGGYCARVGAQVYTKITDHSDVWTWNN